MALSDKPERACEGCWSEAFRLQADALGVDVGDFRSWLLVSEGVLPLKNALGSEHDEEAKVIALAREQCLLYVGCTRAREKLLVTYAQRRSSFLREAGCGLPF
jgi:ATP-dependent exoDNAse (exonuclease V) beta subunit